jgi:hypothetical protein
MRARQRSLCAIAATDECDGVPKLVGICTASTPPGASAVISRGNSSAWRSSQCIVALLYTTSTGASGVQVARSRSSKRTFAAPASDARALSSIGRELSTPTTAAPGQRSARSRVTLPAPQPRSATVRGALAGTRARRSTAGRSLRSANSR